MSHSGKEPSEKRLLTGTQYYQRIAQAVIQQIRKMGTAGWTKAQIPAGYVSGNPPLQLPSESASTLGTKTHKVFQPFSNRTSPPAASQSVSAFYDPDRNRIVGGVIVDRSSYLIDSDSWMGVNPVTPGNTSLDSGATERSTTSTSYVKVKEYIVSIPGRYRFQFRLSRTGGAVASAIVRILKPDGITYLDASVAVTENTAAYPTFSATKTADMTISVFGLSQVSIWLKTTTGTSYIDQSADLFALATAALVPHHATLVD